MIHSWRTQGCSSSLLTVTTTTTISTVSTQNRVVGDYGETPLQLRPGGLGQVGHLTDGPRQSGAHQPCNLHSPSWLVGGQLRSREHNWSCISDYLRQFTLPKHRIPQFTNHYISFLIVMHCYLFKK